ncbi:P-loop containing nucleoside triphosphate hydrolase protein [Baffinella frigidus]|nr:P-loop containing nucleoside triphosphate hydrolase protein [Cryptophyta sp. CCMP2293]
MGLQESENIRVVVRVRPLTQEERKRGDEEHITCVSERSLQVMDTKQVQARQQTGTAFQFGRVFGPETTQDHLFANSGITSLLDHVLEGYSATVFAYGPTGSGKTFSITGRPDSIVKHGSGDATDGIVIRAVEALYIKVREVQRDGLQFKIRASCVEIYNESVIDLLKFSRTSEGRSNLPVKFDTARGSFFVGDLSYGKCPSEEDLLRLYMKALRNRSVASHEMNRDSSRSHAILTIYVDSMVQGEGGHITTRHGKISFVDLAGSERLKDSHSQGSTLRETGSINKSIFTLGKVISSLCDRKKTKVPFRDSKLTQLLMDSIGGTSLTVMLACVSPSSAHVSEALRTLNYATSAKNIKNKPVVLLDPQQNMVEELRKEIQSLRVENKALRDALLSGSVDEGSMRSSMHSTHQSDEWRRGGSTAARERE